MISVAIIGACNIAPAHIEAYLRFPARCRIAAVVDIAPDKACRMKEKYQLDCAVLSDYWDALAMPDIDLVDVCTPPKTHAAICIDALHSGKHVLCEKPMAASLEECDAMIRARDESGKKLSIIAQNRFRKPIRNLKLLLDSGLAGPIRHAQVDSCWWRGSNYFDLWWRGTWEGEGGGCTMNHAVHHIDMLLWMMGLPQRVTSCIANVAHNNAEMEDVSVSILEYPGALAQLTASIVHHGEEQHLVFQCEKAKLSAPWNVRAFSQQPNGFPLPNEALEAELTAYANNLPDLPWEGHTGQIEAMLTSIEQDGSEPVTAQEARATLELVTAIYKAGATRQTVTLPLQRDDPFYTVEGIVSAMPRFHQKTASVQEQEGSITLGSDYQGNAASI